MSFSNSKAFTNQIMYTGSVPKEIIDELDIEHKGWFYENGVYNFKGNVEITKDIVENGKLTIKFGRVCGDFVCSWNKLTSLEGCPTSVGGFFECGGNKLTSLEGCPTSVGGNFYCEGNRLTSLEGFPKRVGGDFLYCSYDISNIKLYKNWKEVYGKYVEGKFRL